MGEHMWHRDQDGDSFAVTPTHELIVFHPRPDLPDVWHWVIDERGTGDEIASGTATDGIDARSEAEAAATQLEGL
jgi:hypothetical protein